MEKKSRIAIVDFGLKPTRIPKSPIFHIRAESMNFEVEQKHRIENPEALVERLTVRGVRFETPVMQSDQYFAHPARDFAQTDEALRIRTSNGASYVTYKGPKLDTATKTRRELELRIDPNDIAGERFAELLRSLGFTPVANLCKERREFQLLSNEQRVQGALDDVVGVGCFIELELIAEEAELEEAQRIICELAAELQLGPPERRSYLEMVLEK